MLQLTLRNEFQGRRLKSIVIELGNSSNTGATQVAAKDFLEDYLPFGGRPCLDEVCAAP